MLYNLGPARTAAGRARRWVVAEGYMDVIALVEAGSRRPCPARTALTDDHLEMLWRVADEPIMALDGDQAGRRAALRAADLALPKLSPGKSLRFCMLPEGKDPDDLIREAGASAMGAALEAAERWPKPCGGARSTRARSTRRNGARRSMRR